MKAGYRRLAYLVLALAPVAPAAMTTLARAQDPQHHDDHDKKVYDRAHKDYHEWNDNEDRAYHQYFQEQHRDYREYSKLSHKQQDQYWKWRHDHPDQDRH